MTLKDYLDSRSPERINFPLSQIQSKKTEKEPEQQITITINSPKEKQKITQKQYNSPKNEEYSLLLQVPMRKNQKTITKASHSELKKPPELLQNEEFSSLDTSKINISSSGSN